MKEETKKTLTEEIASRYYCNNCYSRQNQLLQFKIEETILFLNVLHEIFNDLSNEDIPF